MFLDLILPSRLNTFFNNSHQTTSVTLIAIYPSTFYFLEKFQQLSELELLTYWSTYLYARCNKSVSVATPVYYAHWAARRARTLFSAGADDDDLKEISERWSESGRQSTMYFL
jgi:hypothetical protein